MTKSKIVAPTLISCGLIIPELHFGPFSRKWWLEISTEKGQETFPIRVGIVNSNGTKWSKLYCIIFTYRYSYIIKKPVFICLYA